MNPVVNAKKILTRLARHPAGAKRGNPEYKQDFINNDSNFPMSHYGHISEPTVPNVDIPRFIDPYELRGSVLTPLYGDQTDAGRRLKSILIGDLQFDLDRPVELMGGPRFGLYQRYNEDPNAIWASDKGAVSKYAAGWRGLSEKHGGADVLPVFTGQGRQAQQSNTMFSDVLAQMLNSSPLNRAAVKLFDEGARKIAPNFVGMRSEKLANQLRDMSFDLRGEFMKNYVASKSIQQRGFPDMVAIGNALNDPGVHPDARMAGYVISRADLGNLVNRNPLFPHPSYKNNLHGEVLGGFREQIPAHLLWRPTYEARMPKAEAKYIETNGPYIGRYMDDEAIDEISQYIEDAAAARKLGGYAEGGLSTPEERARRAEEQMGGVTPDGYASSLPPTLSMQFGDLVSPYLDAAYDLFPKENPRGKFLRDMIMGEAPEAARRMAEGEPNVLANTRSRNPLDWKINSEALDMAGALPLATATGALGKVAGAVKASAPLLGGLGIIKQKGGNWLPPVMDPSVSGVGHGVRGINEHTIPRRIGTELLTTDGYERADFRDPSIPWGELKEGEYDPLYESLYEERLNKRNAARKLKFGRSIEYDPESVLEEVNLAHADSYTPEVRENALNYLDKYRESLEAKKEVNTWLQKQLARYMQSDMGTAGDPIRATIERRVVGFDKERDAALREAQAHFDHAAKLEAEGPRPGMPEGTWENAIQAAKNRGQQISEDAMKEYEMKRKYGSSHLVRNEAYLEDLPFVKDRANQNRFLAGFPKETTGISDIAREWDDIVDSSLGAAKKKDIFGEDRIALGDYPIFSHYGRVPPEYFKQALKENPWINNLDGETPFHYMNEDDDARLFRIKQWLLDSITRDDIPDNLKTKLSDLPNLSVGAAVDKAADLQLYNRRKELQKILEDQKNPAIHRMTEYPTGHAWNELKLPEIPEDTYQMQGRELLEKALNMEGNNMAHCVGGYCDKVAEGNSRIFSLRDKDGNPHVTIETIPPSQISWNKYWDSLPNREEVIGPDSELAKVPGNFFKGHQHLYNEASKLYDLPPPPPERVEQIKGKNNSSVSSKYLPMVRDFLQSRGRWGEIGDEHNSGLSDREIRELTEDPALKSEGNYADGGLVDADRNRLNSIISAFLSDNPGQYAEAGEPERAMRELRQDERRRPRGRVDVGFGTNSMTAPGYSRSGFGGGGSGSLQIPAGPATLELGASGGGGRMTARGPGWQQSGGGASLGRAYGELGGLPGLAGRYGVSYENQPLSLYRGMLGLDAQAYSPDGGSPPGAWERAGMVPDEKIMLTYKRDF